MLNVLKTLLSHSACDRCLWSMRQVRLSSLPFLAAASNRFQNWCGDCTTGESQYPLLQSAEYNKVDTSAMKELCQVADVQRGTTREVADVWPGTTKDCSCTYDTSGYVKKCLQFNKKVCDYLPTATSKCLSISANSTSWTDNSFDISPCLDQGSESWLFFFHILL